MPTAKSEITDPRVRRTREMLQQALVRLMEEKDFQNISVQDIADASTVNRATFYDHYADKFALLDDLVAVRFQELLTERGLTFDGTCSSALIGIVASVCDYLGGCPKLDSGRRSQMEPHLRSALVAVVRNMLLEGLRRHPGNGIAPPEMIAATVSWAIFGAANEWIQTPRRVPSKEVAGVVAALVSPILTGTLPYRPQGVI